MNNDFQILYRLSRGKCSVRHQREAVRTMKEAMRREILAPGKNEF